METLNLERCPVRPTLDVFGGKWKPVIVYHLIHDGTLRFGQLRRLLPDATQKMQNINEAYAKIMERFEQR